MSFNTSTPLFVYKNLSMKKIIKKNLGNFVLMLIKTQGLGLTPWFHLLYLTNTDQMQGNWVACKTTTVSTVFEVR